MWNPEQYAKFSNERLRPAIELISRIPNINFKSIIDLGCGNGEITNKLYKQFQPKSMVGLDSSNSMLEKTISLNSEINWHLNNINEFTGSFDLILSNAALQWLDEHELLFNKIISHANKAIAIQMPNNFHCPSHVLLRETISENPNYNKKLAHTVRKNPVLSKEKYYELFYSKVSYIDIWETIYLQPINGENAILEWVKGTALVPIKDALSLDDFNEFTMIN
ncbi:MAG: trans-aconitate methyltransferase [Burkholderiales bacterium]|jgi:trans-aconitate 2-methyltransferase|nr:trans-aconitate methyltransferase [Burkholderiales bacterium]